MECWREFGRKLGTCSVMEAKKRKCFKKQGKVHTIECHWGKLRWKFRFQHRGHWEIWNGSWVVGLETRLAVVEECMIGEEIAMGAPRRREQRGKEGLERLSLFLQMGNTWVYSHPRERVCIEGTPLSTVETEVLHSWRFLGRRRQVWQPEHRHGSNHRQEQHVPSWGEERRAEQPRWREVWQQWSEAAGKAVSACGIFLTWSARCQHSLCELSLNFCSRDNNIQPSPPLKKITRRLFLMCS